MAQPVSTATLSPTPSAASMAVLSPPSSRYAFDTRDDNITSPLLTSTVFRSGNMLSPPPTSLDARFGQDSPFATPSSKFHSELNSYNNWIKHLSKTEQICALDLFLNSCSDEVLQYVRNKVGDFSLNQTSVVSPVAQPTSLLSPSLTVSAAPRPQQPQQMRAASPILALNHEPLTLDNVLNDLGIRSSINSDVAREWSTGMDSMRPRSAGPLDFGDSYYLKQQQPGRVFSPDNTTTPNKRAPVGFGSYGMNFDELSQQNAYKLNALSTIASRTKLDSAKKPEERGRFQQKTTGTYSSSLPPTPRSNDARLSSPPQRKPVSATPTTPNRTVQTGADSPKKSSLPKDIADPALLNNIPAWLKALRLHKYTDNLKHLSWQEMVDLDDAKLEELGVGTVGARGKLLKAFAMVKDMTPKQ